MNRGVWVGGLLLSLCGWVGDLGAQEGVWRQAQQSAGPVPARLDLLPCPSAVALGRPQPLATAGAGGARPQAQTLSSMLAASYRMPAAPPPPGAPVVAAAPVETGSGDADAGLFAIDHAPPPGRFPILAASAIQRVDAPSPAPPTTPVVPPAPAPLTFGQEGEEHFDPFDEVDPFRWRFYARAEYLLWSVKKDQSPPLLSTSPTAEVFLPPPQQNAGFLGRPDTTILFDGSNLGDGTRSGARFTAGVWLDMWGESAVEVSGFFLGDHTTTFNANSSFFPLIARPFFSLNRQAEFAQLTAVPGISTGNAQITNPSRFWGMEIDARCKLWCAKSCPCECACGGDSWDARLDLLGGVRYLDLNENLTITENIQNLASAPAPFTGIRATVFDSFSTHNQFYGGQVALDGQVRRGHWGLDVLGKLALGDTHQDLTINGGQLFISPNGAQQAFSGGLLALRSNSGHFTRDRFSVVPEIDATVSYHFNEHLRVFAGYDFLYWTNVIRPGQQIDRVLDETLIPNFPSGVGPAGQNRPMVLFKESDFWAQGLHAGLEFRY